MPVFRGKLITKHIKDTIQWIAQSPLLLQGKPVCLPLVMQSCQDILSGNIQLSGDCIQRLEVMNTGPIGRYFEYLVTSLISLSPDVEASFSNIVVQDEHRTLGEMDFLYCHKDQWHHVELAVKFYLGVGAGAELRDPHQWYGPQARDRLGLKLEKMFGHQLCLPESVEGNQALLKYGIDRVTSEALVMGRLFHSFDIWKSGNFDQPSMIDPHHPSGWWIRKSDLAHIENSSLTWQALAKFEWMTVSQGAGVVGLQDIDLGNGPLIVAALKDGVEAHRGFVVPDDWLPLRSE